MHECLANKKHIANIFCCYLDQGPTINQSAIDQSKYRVGRYSYFVMRFAGRYKDLIARGTGSISQK